MNDINDVHEQAAALLLIVWRGIDSEFKSQYARDIWRILRDAARTSANQNATLPGFISALARRMDALPGTNAEDREALAALARHEKAILDAMRNDTAYVIALARIALKARRDEGEDNERLV